MPRKPPQKSNQSPQSPLLGASSPSPSERLSSKLDKELAARAYKKVMGGEVPTSQERSALRRFERDQEEQRRWQYYAAIPQKHWRQMSGRQTKVLQEQAERYGLPFGGRTIHLPQLVRGLHNFLAANARRLNPEGDELLEAGPLSPALERYREERVKLARLDRLELEGVLLPRDEVRQRLLRMALILRQATEALVRACGPLAGKMLEEALDTCQRELDEQFGSTPEASINSQLAPPASSCGGPPV